MKMPTFRQIYHARQTLFILRAFYYHEELEGKKNIQAET